MELFLIHLDTPCGSRLILILSISLTDLFACLSDHISVFLLNVWLLEGKSFIVFTLVLSPYLLNKYLLNK